MKSKALHFLERAAKSFEIAIAVLLLVVIAIKVTEAVFELSGFELIILKVEFDRVLSMAFSLVIGVEFTKMLIKLAPETVIDVLLFAVARQTVIYHDNTFDLLIGVVAISGLFAAKRFLVNFFVIIKPQQAPTNDSVTAADSEPASIADNTSLFSK
jgi:hypothetical protein